MASTVVMHGYVYVFDFKHSHVFVNMLPVMNQQVIFIQGYSSLLVFQCRLLTAVHPYVARITFDWGNSDNWLEIDHQSLHGIFTGEWRIE